MSKLLGGLGVVALLALSALAVPARAQTATGVKKAHPTPFYDATKEVTLQGTVENVLRTPSRGMLPGAHVMLATGSGMVDTHVGPFAFKGYHPLSVAPGERVSVVGVMKTVRGNESISRPHRQSRRRRIQNSQRAWVHPRSDESGYCQGESQQDCGRRAMSRKNLSISLIAALAAIFLAACGGSSKHAPPQIMLAMDTPPPSALEINLSVPLSAIGRQ